MAGKDAILACLDLVNDQFSGSKDTNELFTYVEEILPVPKDSFKILSVKGSSEKLKTQVQCQLQNVEEVEVFVKNYMDANNETIRKLTPKFPSTKSPYSTILYYRCQHKTYHQPSMNPCSVLQRRPSKRLKNNDCPFSMVFRLKKIPDEFSCLLDIEWNHNHVIQAGHSFSFEDISSEVIERINTMYEHNYTPGLAYREFVKGLRKVSKDDMEFHENLSHRSKMPRRRDFNQLFTQFKIEKYGSKNLTTMFDLLHLKIKKLIEDEQESDYKIQFSEFNAQENSPLILAFITPLMKRVHTMVSEFCYYLIALI